MYTLMDRPITNVTLKDNYHYHVGSWKKIYMVFTLNLMWGGYVK